MNCHYHVSQEEATLGAAALAVGVLLYHPIGVDQRSSAVSEESR